MENYFDVECPYCGAGQYINHDDGYGYEEDELFNQQCHKCKKYFTFTTTISLLYDVEKADCLNDGEHKYEKTKTFPPGDERMRCTICGEDRPMTPEEKIHAK